MPARYGGQQFGVVYIAPSAEQSSAPALAPALGQRLASICGITLHVLEQGALVMHLWKSPSIGPTTDPVTPDEQADVRAALATVGDGPTDEPLTRRERDVLALMAHGYSSQAIAQWLQIALATVGKHQEHIYGKLRVHTPIDAILEAHRAGLLRYITTVG